MSNAISVFQKKTGSVGEPVRTLRTELERDGSPGEGPPARSSGYFVFRQGVVWSSEPQQMVTFDFWLVPFFFYSKYFFKCPSQWKFLSDTFHFYDRVTISILSQINEVCNIVVADTAFYPLRTHFCPHLYYGILIISRFQNLPSLVFFSLFSFFIFLPSQIFLQSVLANKV